METTRTIAKSPWHHLLVLNRAAIRACVAHYWRACAPELQPPPSWIGKRRCTWPRPLSSAGLLAIPTLRERNAQRGKNFRISWLWLDGSRRFYEAGGEERVQTAYLYVRSALTDAQTHFDRYSPQQYCFNRCSDQIVTGRAFPRSCARLLELLFAARWEKLPVGLERGQDHPFSEPIRRSDVQAVAGKSNSDTTWSKYLAQTPKGTS